MGEVRVCARLVGIRKKKDFRRQLKSGEGGGGRQVQEMGGGEDVTRQSEALF
jgi:hypothetical protein